MSHSRDAQTGVSEEELEQMDVEGLSNLFSQFVSGLGFSSMGGQNVGEFHVRYRGDEEADEEEEEAEDAELAGYMRHSQSQGTQDGDGLDDTYLRDGAGSEESEESDLKERERELLEHIQTVEQLQEMEERYRQEKALHAAATSLLITQTQATKKAEDERDKLAQQLQAVKAERERDIETLRQLHAKEMSAFVDEIQRMEIAHSEEVASLRGKIAELRKELAGVSWNSGLTEETKALSLDELFNRFLGSQSAAECDGIAKQIGTILNEDRDAMSWVENSGWVERLSRCIEETRGCGLSTALCIALSAIPQLVHRFSSSNIFACLSDVLALEAWESHIVSIDLDAVEEAGKAHIPPRFRRGNEEWAQIRHNLAVVIRNCVTVLSPYHTHQDVVVQFVSAPKAPLLLMQLCVLECKRGRRADRDTLDACGDALFAIAECMPQHEGIAAAFVAAGGLAAIRDLLAFTGLQLRALQTLDIVSWDLTWSEKCVQANLVAPLVAVLRQASMHLQHAAAPIPDAHALKDGATDAAAQDSAAQRLLQAALSVLVKLSRVRDFAKDFIELGGHLVLNEVLNRHVDAGTRVSTAETLVNVLVLYPEAGSVVVHGGALGAIVEVLVETVNRKSPVLSRAMDVLSHLLASQPKTAARIPPSAFENLARVVGTDIDSLAYKSCFFLFNYMKSEDSNLKVIVHPAVFSLVLALSKSHGFESQLWISHVLSQILTRILPIPPTSDIALNESQRKNVQAALAHLVAEGRAPGIQSMAAIALLKLLLYAWKCGDKTAVAGQLDTAALEKITSALEDTTHAEELSNIAASLAEVPDLVPALEQMGEALLPLLQGNDEKHVSAIDKVCVAVWSQPALDGEAKEGKAKQLVEGKMLQLLQQTAGSKYGMGALRMLFALLLHVEHGGLRAAVLRSKGLALVAQIMRQDNRMFVDGSRIIALCLQGEGAAPLVMEQAGLALLLDMLGVSEDALVKDTIAKVLPCAFDDELVCNKVASSGIVAHLIALADTSPTPLQMNIALDILNRMLNYKRPSLSLVQCGGLRVLADLAMMEQYSAYDRSIPQASSGSLRAEDVLVKLLDFGKELSQAIADEGSGAGVLLQIIERSESDRTTEKAIKCLSDLCATRAAADILREGGAKILGDWLNHPTLDVPDRTEEWSQRVRNIARVALVRLAWNVQSSKGNEREVIHALIQHGALPAFIQSADYVGDSEDETELKRISLWALATWFSFDDTATKADFIRAGGMPPLLKVTESNSTVEMQRYARVALSKLLTSMGEELTERISVLRAHLDHHPNLDELWSQLAESVIQPPAPAPSVIPHVPAAPQE